MAPTSAPSEGSRRVLAILPYPSLGLANSDSLPQSGALQELAGGIDGFQVRPEG